MQRQKYTTHLAAWPNLDGSLAACLNGVSQLLHHFLGCRPRDATIRDALAVLQTFEHRLRTVGVAVSVWCRHSKWEGGRTTIASAKVKQAV